MKLTTRALTQAERLYTYAQSRQILTQTGMIGYLRGDFGDRQEFYTTCFDQNEARKTDAFQAELDEVINSLRFDDAYGKMLSSRNRMAAICAEHPGSAFDEVTISKDVQTVTKDNSGHDLTIYNNIWTGKLSILKVNGMDNTPLSGAVFTLTGSDGSESTLTTGDDGTVTFENLLFGIAYVWKETKAPKGYLLSEDNTGIWSVEEHDAEIQYTAKDDRRPGSITVTKQNTDGQPLFGATFLLEYKDGDSWKPVYHSDSLAKGGTTSNVTDGKLTTDESGTITFENLWADEEIQYRLTEVAAPEGYELLKEPVFEGTLPASYPDGKVTATPDEVIDGTAYFYDLPITVRNGHIYTLPMTGGSGFPFAGVGIAALVLGLLLLANVKYPIILKNLKRRISYEN